MKKIPSKTIIYINALILAMLLISVQTNMPILAKEVNIDSGIIGVVLSLNPLLSIIFSIPFAIIADKINRKAVIFTGVIFSFLAVLITYSFPSILGFGIAKCLEGMCMAAFFPAGIAFVTDISKKCDLSENIAKFTAILYAGFLVSPIISGVIGKYYDVKAIFLFLSLLAFVNIIICGLLFLNKDFQLKASKNTDLSQDLKSITKPTVFTSVLSFALVFGFMIGVIRTIWPIYLNDLNVDILLINLSYTVYSIPIVLTSTYFGKWADKNDDLTKPIVLGGLLIALGQLSYLLIPIHAALALLKAIEGLGYGILYPTTNSAMVKSVDETFKGRALGSYNFVRTSGQFIGTFASGFMYKYLLVLPFIINFSLMAIATVITGFVLKNNNKK